MEPYSWTCPFCDRDATIGENDHNEGTVELHVETAHGLRELRGVFVVCPNPKCRRATLRVELYHGESQNTRFGAMWKRGPLIGSWQLVPPSQAKVFPDYVPKAIRDDYQEACLIRDLSPKASATLSRRCLQGMIRDFWKVAKPKLAQEIEAIKDDVDSLTWDAIDSVRSVGNIGAHMEKDINLVIDVDPQEAGLLIWLIEHLVKDWHMNRHEREERLKALKAVADAKTEAKATTTDAT
jgi:hypothetical protein